MRVRVGQSMLFHIGGVHGSALPLGRFELVLVLAGTTSDRTVQTLAARAMGESDNDKIPSPPVSYARPLRGDG